MKTLLLSGIALAMLTIGASAQTVRLGTEGAYEPWNFMDASGQVAGLDIDVGNALCERAGLTCEWVINDWDTIIPNLLAGNYDAILAGMSITEERQQSIDFTADYSPPDVSRFMVLTGTTLDFDALQNARVGVQSNTIQAGYAQDNLATGNSIVAFEVAPQALADLSAGAIDVILADESYVAEIVANSGGAFELIGPEIEIGGGVGAGLRKSDTELKARLDEALAAAKADGTIDSLIAKWFPQREGPFYLN